MRRLVRSQVAARLKVLEAELRRPWKRPEDPDTIHDLRVAIRRLAQCLRAFEEWLDPIRTKRIRKRLRKLMDSCGAVRNCDIAVEVLQAAGWPSGEVTADLERRRSRAQKKLMRRLRSWRRRKRAASWREHLRVKPQTEGPWRAGGSALANARRILAPMAEEFFRAGWKAAEPSAAASGMHRFRLIAKRFRYTVELFGPVYGERTKPGLECLQRLQDKLGAISDCATTARMVAGSRRAASMVRRLARQRETDFQKYWRLRFGTREKIRWKSVLEGRRGEE